MDYKEILEKIYKDVFNTKDVPPEFEGEYSSYLKGSIETIDKLWDENFEKFENVNQKVKLVILGEAPMWGDSKSYIYRHEAPDSSFFRLSNLGIRIKDKNKRKPGLLSELIKRGIIFLDVSPFPLNPKNTSVCYRNRKQRFVSKKIGTKIYERIITETFENHLKPKLIRIYGINKDEPPRFIYRYKKVQEVHKTLHDCCEKSGLLFPKQPDIHISLGRNINLEELNKVLSDITNY